MDQFFETQFLQKILKSVDFEVLNEASMCNTTEQLVL